MNTVSTASEATQILIGLRDGDRSGVGRLMELVYDEMRGLASHYVRRRSFVQALQPTELVHEVFLKLVDHENADWRSRSHFYAVAATAMRQILVDDARKRLSLKRGGGQVHLSLSEELTISVQRDEDLLVLDDALELLAATKPERARLVELRFFGGMTVDEVAEATGTAKRTVEREWRVTRAWLRRELNGARAR